MTKKLEDYTKEELLEVVKGLKKRKKFGLVWEDKPEKVVTQCLTELPVLNEVSKNEVSSVEDGSNNIIIEGDNYHALSVLNYTHSGKIGVIYIDPPYNTGKAKEWKFNDNWVDKNDTYKHSKWLSFMAKRLKLAFSLLSEDGVMFVSIDDNEYHNLKLLCDEVFTESGFVGCLVWEKKKKGSHLDGEITNIKEYVLVYKKSPKFKGLIGQITEEHVTYPCLNPGNGYSVRLLPAGVRSNYAKSEVNLPAGHKISAGNMRLTLLDELVIKDNILAKDVRIEAEWRYQQSSLDVFAKEGTLYFTRDLYLRNLVTKPRYKKLKDVLARVSGSEVIELHNELLELCSADELDEASIKQIASEISLNVNTTDFHINNLLIDGWGSNEDADNEQRDFFGKKVFDYPKPTKLIKKIIASSRIKEGIVLDFFAGSGTTAQAVLELNQEPGYNLRFLLCTNNEDNNENGLKIADDICLVRVKKVIEGYEKRNDTKVEGIPANLKYFTTSFVSKKQTDDQTRAELVTRSTEMICLREDAFSKVIDVNDYKVFEGSQQFSVIVFNTDTIDELKAKLNQIKSDKQVNIYVFSLSNDTYESDFTDLEKRHELRPIPESILEVYRRIFADQNESIGA